MEAKKIARINALARKAKTEGLTAEETAEQRRLRREYVNSFKKNLVAQLENTYIIDEKGNKSKLKKRDEDEDD